MDLFCNSCSSRITTKAFKTICDHVFCERCAQEMIHGGGGGRCGHCGATTINSRILEFQIVGSTIPEEQLVEVVATLHAVTAANGTGCVDAWTRDLVRFDRIQQHVKSLQQEQRIQQLQRQAEETERQWMESEKHLSTLQRQLEQVTKENSYCARTLSETQLALEERSRQAESWKAMYDALKNGAPPPPGVSSSSSSLTFMANNAASAIRPPPSPVPPPSSPSERLQKLPSRILFQPLDENRVNNNPIRRRPSTEGMDVAPFTSNGDTTSTALAASSSWSAIRAAPQQPIMRPPSRDAIGALLNRNFTGAGTGPGGIHGPPPGPIRSSFFTPQSLRAISPQTQQHRPIMQSHQQGGGGNSNSSSNVRFRGF